MRMRLMVTGAADFIGFHVAARPLDRGDTVLGIDDMNAYYDVSFKEAHLAELERLDGFEFRKIDIADREGMSKLF